MKHKRLLLLLFLLTPSVALAHGEQALIPFGIGLINLAVFIYAVSIIRLTVVGKAIMVVFFLTALSVAVFWTLKGRGYLDYLENMTFTNLLILTIPWIVYLVVFFLVKRRFKKAE